MFYPYPPDVPTGDVFALVADALRNKAVDVKEASHAVWHVGGYGLSQWDTHNPAVGTVSDPDAAPEGESEVQKTARRGFESGAGKAGRKGRPRKGLTREEAAEHLTALRAARSGEAPAAAAVPWGLILPVLAKLLEELLKNWGK
jgi:hypothetical protein